MIELKNIIYKIDLKVFIIIVDIFEVCGKGFINI